MKKIGILGSGGVAKALSKAFVSEGYKVMVGSRDLSKLEKFDSVEKGSFADVANFADLLVLAVKGTGARTALHGLDLSGKTIIDATNPIADAPPSNGVLQFFTPAGTSLIQTLQEQHPDAYFVKAFNSVGSALMYKPNFGGQKPTMFICGNNAQAKQTVTDILTAFGWETEDMGSAEAGSAIEQLCVLWCLPGFLQNRWNHAFKLLK